jgi:hypothetical protein
LYRELTEGALEYVKARAYPLVLNFSSGPTNRIASLAAGWRQAFSIAHWVRDARLGVIERLGRAAGLGTDPFEKFAQLGDVESNGRRGCVSLRSDPRATAMAELIERVAWDGRIRQPRDADFFEWRFRGPMAINRFVYCYDGDTLRGYLVLQAKRHRPGSIVVVDFEADHDEVLGDLLDAAIAFTEGFRLEVWADGIRSRAENLLAASGFRASAPAGGVRSAGPAVLVRTLDMQGVAAIEDASGRRIRERGDWDLRPVYSDAH